MKAKAVITIGILLLIPSILFLSCSQQKSDWQGSIEVVDGVTIVKNPAEPVHGEFTFDLEENLVIGGQVDDDNYYFPRRVALSVDDQGNIYVLDTGNFRVQKYDSSGLHLLSIGRQGQGPGEFQYASDLSVDTEGNLRILDSDARAIKVFTKDGQYLRTLKIMTFIQPQLFISQEGFIFGWRDDYRPPDGPKVSILKLRPEKSEIETVAEFQGELKSNQPWFAIHWYTTRLAMCPLNSTAFCYGHSSEYKIYVADGNGETIRIIEKYEEPTPITRAEKDATVKDGIYAMIGRSQLPEDGEGVVFPSHRPYFGRMFADDRGRLYVSRHPSILNKDGPKEFDVFSEGGSYLYRTKLPYFPALIKAGFLYEIRTDEDTGEITIVRHKITNWEEYKSRGIT